MGRGKGEDTVQVGHRLRSSLYIHVRELKAKKGLNFTQAIDFLIEKGVARQHSEAKIVEECAEMLDREATSEEFSRTQRQAIRQVAQKIRTEGG